MSVALAVPHEYFPASPPARQPASPPARQPASPPARRLQPAWAVTTIPPSRDSTSSLYLKTHRTEYYRLLQEVREHGNWEAWLTSSPVLLTPPTRRLTPPPGSSMCSRKSASVSQSKVTERVQRFASKIFFSKIRS
ncbi:hypothetical protein SAMN05216228_101336 [Rhizobium tibeticum]|uniref:Uncharacterized protein n=1 Tax=Rhizobium tibeticum TaxID=501024 RepID=A0A1H8MSI2_9HYPH|nr:hypothetical protein RTCCBAU85039_4704 [Rhizobium tibeticum]SEO20208.1 hypothetical protein SAMN05216228_101336 [Rhizobium tibeticum]